MDGEISRPPYEVREAVAGGKELAAPFEVNTEPRDTEESGHPMTVQEAGRRGGLTTLENQGRDFFSQIGKKGGERTAELYRNLLSQFGRRGGRPKRPTLDEPMGEEVRQ